MTQRYRSNGTEDREDGRERLSEERTILTVSFAQVTDSSTG